LKLLAVIITIPILIYYLLFYHFATWLMLLQILGLVIFFMQVFYVGNAIWIVLRSNKRRKPPTMLRLDAFIIPLFLGYLTSIGILPGIIDLR